MSTTGATVKPSTQAAASRAAMLQHPLVRPLGALVALLLVDAFLVPGFFHLEMKEGHLYGAIIDILNRAAPLMLAALGMTLVIATRGIDISVGAVVALSGTVSAMLIGGSEPTTPMALALAASLGVALLCGLWNGVLVAGIKLQPIVATLILMVAGRGLAQLLTDGQIVTVYYEPFFFLGGGYLAGLPFSLFVVAAVFAVTLITFVYVFCSACAGLAGMLITSNIKSADANNAGLLLELDAILAVTLGGTSLAGGKFSLVGSMIGALIIQTLTYTIYSLGVPPEVNMVVKSIVVFVVCISQSSEFKNILRRSA
jgi:simple sugar transport system permease protein